MGRVIVGYLDASRLYCCSKCRTHLTSESYIISKAFQGKGGVAYLFDTVINTSKGPPEDRMLLTGLHTVRDVFCKCCNSALGWTYDAAYESKEKYKVGKFVLELVHMIREDHR